MFVAPTRSRCPWNLQVLYRGKPIGRGTAALKPYRREVQLVLQDPTGALNPRQSVYESVAEGLRIHGVKGDEETLVEEALARSGLRPPRRFFLAYPHELSGGQRQRVVIAGRWPSSRACWSPTSPYPAWTPRSGARS